MFKFIIITVVLICAGVFLWPLILTSGRRLSAQFSALWQASDNQESELDNDIPPPNISSDSPKRSSKQSSSGSWQEP